MQGKLWWPWLLATLMLGGCGRTSRDCQLCGDGAAGEGGSSNGGVSFGGAGVGGTTSAGASFAGSAPMAGAPLVCPYGYDAPATPLVSYSPLDLVNTMNDVVGPGPDMPPSYEDRADAGSFRSVSGPFISNLYKAATARVDAVSLQGAPLMPCAAGTSDQSTCINGWIAERGLRLYRRQLTGEQIATYAAAFSQQLTSSTPEAAAKNLLLSMLLSPYFVYRIELGANASRALTLPPGIPLPQPAPAYPLSDYEIAARLSHFTWRSAPDAQLLASAAAGELSRTDGVLAAFDRLLADPRSVPARTQEVLEWLELEQWGALSPDMPSDANRLEHEQTSRFIADVLTNRNGSFSELLTSPKQPLNDLLAEQLGIPAGLGASFEMVDLDPTFYAGIFGQPAWLRRSPHPSQRGMRISSQFLCVEIPQPPAFEPPLGPGNTPRERISSVTAGNPACNSCHSLFDPAGFALEAFDDQARLTGFDTSGALRLPSSGNMVPVAGPPDLGKTLATENDGKVCAALHAIQYLLQTKQLGGDLQTLATCVTSNQAGHDLSLNEMARQIASSAAMLQTLRPPSSAVGVGKSADPIQHAIEETLGLVATLPPEDARILQPYQSALSELQGLPPAK
ncbi:MAG TPA: DUF1592 domain-containing protein [Polyangiaceae bacterium]|nr:DUF1592 domain-containing protein [Polyangiaceae bacterium]